MKKLKPIHLVVLPLMALVGCGTGDEGGEQQAVEPAAEQSALEGLPAEAVQRLVAEYPVLGEDPVPQPEPGPNADDAPRDVIESTEGEATFYADSFEGRRTASGIPFRQNQFVAAHRAFPFGTLLRVTNLRNDRSVNVRVVDRGPHGSRAQARNTIIDLSRRAAEALDYTAQGRTPVRVEVLEWGDGLPQTG